MIEFAVAERALHERTRLTGGLVECWEQDGLLAVLAEAPQLRFLRTITGITAQNLPAAITLATDKRCILVLPPGLDAEPLVKAGFTPDGHRVLATRRLDDVPALDPDVTPAHGTGMFLKVLLDGYQSTGAVAKLIAVEHSAPGVQRFLLGTSAAAAMTVHGTTAVLGGAATLPEHRGEGAQRRLLDHRLALAAAQGCRLAVATAAPDSPSAANLARTGFRLHARPAWRR